MRQALMRFMSAGLLGTGLPLGLIVTPAAAATAPQHVSATTTFVSNGDLTCEYGVLSQMIAFGTCAGSGTWTLNVACNLDPVFHRVTTTQHGGTVTEDIACLQGVNSVLITF